MSPDPDLPVALPSENGDLIKKRRFSFPTKEYEFPLSTFPPSSHCPAASVQRSLCYSFRVATAISRYDARLVSVHGLSTRCDRPRDRRDRQVVSAFSRGHPVQGRGLTHGVAAGRRDGTRLVGGRTERGGGEGLCRGRAFRIESHAFPDIPASNCSLPPPISSTLARF